jgi:co-chaperonin GroES (HSP10)
MIVLPRNNNLLVRHYERPEHYDTGGLILVPDCAREDISGWLWEVVEVGPGKLTRKGHRVPCECRVGDIIETSSRFVAEKLPPIDSQPAGLYLVNEEQVSHILWRPDDDQNN